MLVENDVDFPYAQTMGYIKAHLNNDFTEINPESPLEDIKENLCKFYQFTNSPDYLMLRTDRNHPNILPVGEALLEEHYSPERDFAYQGANPTIGLLYDIYGEMRRQLMGLQREDLFVCRGTDQAFQGLDNVADFINEQLRKQNTKSFGLLDNYKADFAEKALSINFFLVGNCGTGFDDTMKFFIKGESDRDIRLKRSLMMLFTYLGLDMAKSEDIESLIAEFEALPLLDRGRLFQFSFARGSIDEFCYLSGSLGRGRTLDGSMDYDIRKKQVATLLHGIRKDPQKMLQLSKKTRRDDMGFPEPYFDLPTIQGRYLSHPKLGCEESPLSVQTYWRGLSQNAPEVLEYKQLLKGLVRKIVWQALQSKVVLPTATFLTFGPEGISGKIEDQEATLTHLSDPLLSAYLCAGDLKQVSHIFSSNKLIDINKRIIDINDLEDQTDHSPLYLGVKYNHPEIVHYLLSNGARIENEPADTRNLIGWACINGYPNIVDHLLDSGCDPNTTFRGCCLKEAIIILAQEYGHTKIVESLRNHQDFVFTKDLSEKFLERGWFLK